MSSRKFFCVVISLGCFILAGPLTAQESASERLELNWALAIHGGAGGNPTQWSERFRNERIESLGAVLDIGSEMLNSGASAMDVAERLVREMEDNPVFNAGRGCVLNDQGEHELDASIMDGSNRNCGAVGSVKRIRHPISLARKVMTETRHILLIGKGADEFGVLQGLETASDDFFRTERQLKNWKSWKQRNAQTNTSWLPGSLLNQAPEQYYGTVGCVVRDTSGNLAAATSTGGLMGKRWGRVGDSPIIGAGNYADNATCAVSGTGIGEEFIRNNIAADVAARMRYAKLDLETAAQAAVESLPDNCGGIICVDAKGNVTMPFNTRAMSRAYAKSDGSRAVSLQ